RIVGVVQRDGDVGSELEAVFLEVHLALHALDPVLDGGVAFGGDRGFGGRGGRGGNRGLAFRFLFFVPRLREVEAQIFLGRGDGRNQQRSEESRSGGQWEISLREWKSREGRFAPFATRNPTAHGSRSAILPRA